MPECEIFYCSDLHDLTTYRKEGGATLGIQYKKVLQNIFGVPLEAQRSLRIYSVKFLRRIFDEFGQNFFFILRSF